MNFDERLRVHTFTGRFESDATGNNNTANGFEALASNQTGSNNTASAEVLGNHG